MPHEETSEGVIPITADFNQNAVRIDAGIVNPLDGNSQEDAEALPESSEMYSSQF